MKTKVIVEELIKKLKELPPKYEVVIYPKYENVDGYKKHTFMLENVCEQEPHAVRIKDNKEKIKQYFGEKKIEEYMVNKHVAIIF
jgi:predicted P-loop ATPase/GTPase